MEGLSKRNRKRVCLRSAGESQDHPTDWFPGAAGLPKGGHMVLRRLISDMCVWSRSVISTLGSYGLQSIRLLCPWDFPGKNTGVGSHSLLQANFLTQGSNPCLLCLLHWQVDSCAMSHLGSPDTMNELRHVQHNETKWVRWEQIFQRILGVRMLCQDDVTASKYCMYSGSQQGTSVNEWRHVWLS